MNVLNGSLYAVASSRAAVLVLLARRRGTHSHTADSITSSLSSPAADEFTLELSCFYIRRRPPSSMAGLHRHSFLRAPCLWLYRAPDHRSTHTARRATFRAGRLADHQLRRACWCCPLIERTHIGTEYVEPGSAASACRSVFIHGTMLAAAVALFGLQAPLLPSRVRAYASAPRRRRRRPHVSADIDDRVAARAARAPSHACRALDRRHGARGLHAVLLRERKARARPWLFRVMRSGGWRCGRPFR